MERLLSAPSRPPRSLHVWMPSVTCLILTLGAIPGEAAEIAGLWGSLHWECVMDGGGGRALQKGETQQSEMVKEFLSQALIVRN